MSPVPSFLALQCTYSLPLYLIFEKLILEKSSSTYDKFSEQQNLKIDIEGTYINPNTTSKRNWFHFKGGGYIFFDLLSGSLIRPG